jgi:hypothetical protein
MSCYRAHAFIKIIGMKGEAENEERNDIGDKAGNVFRS